MTQSRITGLNAGVDRPTFWHLSSGGKENNGLWRVGGVGGSVAIRNFIKGQLLAYAGGAAPKHRPGLNFKIKNTLQHRAFRPVMGAGLAILSGLLLWHAPIGEPLANASYDYLFRFGSRAVTNHLILVYLDDQAYTTVPGQRRGQPWSRALHARLLDRLTADGARLVVFDIHFEGLREPAGDDDLLASALKRNGHVVLMAEQARTVNLNIYGAEPTKPHPRFVEAAGTNWGVACVDIQDRVVRKHWPFPSPGPYPSLPWKAAQLAGAQLEEAPPARWLRYYGVDGPWTPLSYAVALTQSTNFFRNAIVFIGNRPSTPAPDGEPDEFEIPYTRWTGESVGGVDVLATMFLNLMNNDWLTRSSVGLEAALLVLTGLGLGAGLSALRPVRASLVGAAAAIGMTLGGVTLPHVSPYWFPWLVITAVQVPVAWGWAMATRHLRWPAWQPATAALRRTLPGVPDSPDYEIIGDPFGEGHFGKVWLARNAVGQWQALKAVYRSKFGQDSESYETEFNGIRRYKPVSDKHPGLLRVDFVSRHKEEGYFYYVMELGDSLNAGWEKDPRLYAPRDLFRARQAAAGGRLEAGECIRIGADLAETLEFLHREGLTHRDIKPSNVVFVNGRPKLADVGLVGAAKTPDQVTTFAGTPGFMPPWPEPPGTVIADIYGLGMLLYVISTGSQPTRFPTLESVLLDGSQTRQFMQLNRVILQACRPEPSERYASATALRAALLEITPPVPPK